MQLHKKTVLGIYLNQGNRKMNEDWEQNEQIFWEDSEDVYKPIPQPISEFTAERAIRTTDKKVYIKADALRQLTAHLGSNLRVEQGGILFGNAYEDPEIGIYVEITVAVAAPATIGTGAHLEFTSDSWLGIMDYAKSEHPAENIVGWYHSHPNLGVFMSGTDMNTQQAFFYHPWCLSIVYDPVSGHIGFFLGANAVRVNPIIFKSVQQLHKNLDKDEPHQEQDVQDSPPKKKGKTRLTTRAIAPKNPREPRKEKNFLIDSPVLFISVGLLILFFVFGTLIFQIYSQILHNQSQNQNRDYYTRKPRTTFKAEIKTMPREVLTYLEKEPSLLNSQIIKPISQLGNGKEITLLAISQQGEAKAEAVNLELEELTPHQNQKNVQLSQLIATSEADIKRFGSAKILEPININFVNQNQGLLIPLFSFQKIRNNNNPSKKESEVIYIPRRIIYQDSSQKSQKIEIKEILDNG